MVADLDGRIRALRTQCDHLRQEGTLLLPVETAVQDTPRLAPLSAPAPSPIMDRQTAQFQAQDLVALQRELDHERARRLAAYQLQAQEAAASTLQARSAQLQASAAQQRQRITAQHAPALLNAALGLKMQLTRWPLDADGHEVRPTLFLPLREAAARQANETAQTAYRQELARVAQQLATDIAAATATGDEAMHTQIAAFTQTVSAENAQVVAQHRAQFPEEAPETPLPPMGFTAQPAGRMRLALPGCTQQFTVEAARVQRQRQREVREIQQTIAELSQDRQQLLTDMERDTRAAVSALAEQHGYRITFAPHRGGEVTDAAYHWLAAYWGP
jgi:hypothetical protein